LFVEQLETRRLLCVTIGPDGRAILDADGDAAVGSPPILDPPIVSLAGGSGTRSGGAAAAAASIPALSSRPGAPASLYLNFGGDTVASWLGYTPGVIPAYGGTSTAMEEIWQVVAENYSPFNLNVTTVKPTSGAVSQVDVGGNGAWTGGTYGGIGQVGGIGGSSPSNPVRGFVFPDNLGGGYYWYVADASTHESGHTMGLQHQSAWSGGTKTDEYQSGPGDGTAPTMGNSYSAGRSMWWYGLNTNDVYQDDMTVIGSNAFGYAPVATGTTAATAHPLTVSGNTLAASGVLDSMTQTDDWSFTTGGGPFSFTVSDPYSSDLGAAYGNLHPKLEITDGSGNVVVNWQDPDSVGVSWSGSLAAGSYRIVVGSHGISGAATADNYGFDVGTYFLSGTTGSLPGAPTGVTATPGVGQVTVSWNSSGDATSYNLYRATASGGEVLYRAGITTTSFVDTGVANGTTYDYEVSAVNAGGESALSGEVQATPYVPTETRISVSPAGVSVAAGASQPFGAVALDQFGNPLATQPAFTWTVDPGGAGGSINAAGQYTAPSLGAGGSDTVRAADAITSGTASVTVIGLPAAPTNLVATGISTSQINLSWTDHAVNETSYSVERSVDGTTWSVIASNLAANTTSYVNNSGLTSGATYSYRVRCFNGSQASGYSNTAVAVAAYPAVAAPSNLVATAISSGQINLTWADNTTAATAYEVLRSTTGTGGWSVIVNNLASTATSYSDARGLSAGTTSYYEVVALNHTTPSGPSNVASAATWPATPGNLAGAGTYNAADPNHGAINLSWQDNATNETSYSVERSTNNKTWGVIATLAASSTSYGDTGLTPGATYYYRVRCFNGPTASAYTSAIRVVAAPTAPAQPTGLSVRAVSASQISLTWQDNAINETSYSVERSTNNKTWSVIATLAANSTGYADTGLAASTTYYYRVRAFDGTLASTYTSAARASTPAAGPALILAPGSDDVGSGVTTGKGRGSKRN
jgi:fibronectin type 3 domain-containing protein